MATSRPVVGDAWLKLAELASGGTGVVSVIISAHTKPFVWAVTDTDVEPTFDAGDGHDNDGSEIFEYTLKPGEYFWASKPEGAGASILTVTTGT